MIRFKFRCTAFGYAYFDCITPAGTFEIRHGNGVSCGYTHECPPIEPHWSGIITPEVQAAWRDYCASEYALYLRWCE